MANYSIVIHGGAGTILRQNMTPALESTYRHGLQEGLDVGYEMLASGGTAVEAIRAAVVSLENHILFNAGKGSVFANDGSQEMDASIMDGKNLMAGAVSAVRNVRNPIELAYAVMTRTEHVYVTGAGAKSFAESIGISMENDEYFYSPLRYQQWQKSINDDSASLDHNVQVDEKKFGTVGAAACDIHGNIAAATSTGGMTNKRWGRVGDSPIIGAGTYANNATCAISCTGHGELFIRAVAAYDVSCLMEYKGLSLRDAMNVVVMDKLVKINGEGGMIGVDAKGNAEMIFNSEGMYRGVRTSSGKNEVSIYKDLG